MYKAIITCAVTGAETTKRDNPNLPVSPTEIADAAHEAFQAGASILHLHVRDKDGLPTQNLEIFRETIDLIRKKCDIVIEVTTGGAVGMTLEERLQPLMLNPEMASLDCGSVNFGDDYLVNTLPMMRDASSIMLERNIRPTLECFDLSHIDASRILIEEGLVKPPFHYSFVLNVPGGVRYDVDTLGFFARRVPKESQWTVVGIGGKAHLPFIYGGISLRGNIRVGFEDTVYYDKGVLAESNAQLVERVARIIREFGGKVATPADVRKLLKLRSYKW